MSPSRILKARIAVSLLFMTNGAIYANLLPRLPEIKDMFELSNAMYGLVLIALPIGGVVAGPLPAPIIRRFGTARAAAPCSSADTAGPEPGPSAFISPPPTSAAATAQPSLEQR